MHKSLVFGGFFLVGISIIGFIYGPLMWQEVAQVNRSNKPINQDVKPVSDEFAIVIPKIGANSLVVADVDPLDPTIYQKALSEGVAHALGSALPGQPGSVFLFAHSSVNFLEAKRFNSVFYLLHWLKPKDDIYITYNQKKYHYQVKKVEKVDADRVEYLYQYQPQEQLVLMTCWPPGTDIQRLIVTATLN